MCLIINKPNAQASFSIPDFKTSQFRNSDGTGIMYVEDGRVKTEKVMGPIKDHLDLYAKHMHRSQFILHHRMGTHGEKSLLNVHPFEVLSMDKGDPYDLFMCHNGVIGMSKFSTDHDKKLSDTHLFALEYLQPMLRKYPDIITNNVFQIMLHDFIGTGNKLAFMTNIIHEAKLEDGTDNPNAGQAMVWIFNKSQGVERNGCWLSNGHSTTTYNTNIYGANHGVKHHTTERLDYDNDGYEYSDGAYFRTSWNSANKIKEKSTELMSTTDVDSLLDNINLYSGMQEQQLEQLFIDEPHLVYDMIYLMDSTTVTKSLLNEAAPKVAARLYTLLQGYAKKKAA